MGPDSDKMGQKGLNLVKLGHAGSNGTKWGKTEQNRVRQKQGGSSRSNRVKQRKTGQNREKWGQTVQRVSNVF